jgi:hypothetical protein
VFYIVAECVFIFDDLRMTTFFQYIPAKKGGFMAKKAGFKFGIVGCGMVSDFHARAITAMRGGHLGCVFSRDMAHARPLGEKYRSRRVGKGHGVFNRSASPDWVKEKILCALCASSEAGGE